MMRRKPGAAGSVSFWAFSRRDHLPPSQFPNCPTDVSMGVEIEGQKVYRTVAVEPGKLTWVEFRPDAH